MLNGKSILVTGGTGSFGREFVKTVLNRYPRIKRLAIFSRDELKQFEMEQVYSEENFPAMRYFIGDVRDRERLKRALENVEIVIHAAALKQVPLSEKNPFEVIKTNVFGAQNLIEACFDSNVKKVIALSTDKAAAPINLYGATKLCSDKLFTSLNSMTGDRDISFSVVRYGNVMGSRGSVLPLFLEKCQSGILPITHPEMTRFNITLEEGIDAVLWSIKSALGGEIIVPKIPSFRILDLARAIDPDCKHKFIGIRAGEKLHEEMITISDGFNTVDLGKYYAILPSFGRHSKEKYCSLTKSKPLEKNFSYNSATNKDFLTVEQLKNLIKKTIKNNISK